MTTTKRTRRAPDSVVGFCKLLGATGFQQLKVSLAQQIGQLAQYFRSLVAWQAQAL